MPLGLPLQLGNVSPLFGDAFAGREQGQRHSLGSQSMKLSGAGFIQFPAQRRVDDSVDCSCRPWPHGSLHTSARNIAQASYFNIIRPRDALQTADVLHVFSCEHLLYNDLDVWCHGSSWPQPNTCPHDTRANRHGAVEAPSLAFRQLFRGDRTEACRG